LAHLLNEQNEWDLFASALESVPFLVSKIQDILSTKYLADLTEENALNGTMSDNVTTSPAQKSEPPSASGLRARQRAQQAVSTASAPSQLLTPAQQAIIKERNQRDTKIRTEVENSVNSLLRAKGLLPEYVWKLRDDGPVSELLPHAAPTTESHQPNGAPTVTANAQAQQMELRRRNLLSSVRIKADIRVNGKVVTHTDYYSLNSQLMSVEFRQYFELRVLTQPREIAIDLYMRQGTTCAGCCGFGDTYIGTVYVHSPGAQLQSDHASVNPSTSARHRTAGVAHTFSPVACWYEFSSLDIDPSLQASYSYYNSCGSGPGLTGKPRVEVC
jgi:hypothetical protein